MPFIEKSAQGDGQRIVTSLIILDFSMAFDTIDLDSLKETEMERHCL